MKFISVICPLCKWTTVGIGKRFGTQIYLVHFMENHYQEPIITEVKNDQRTEKKHKRIKAV